MVIRLRSDFASTGCKDGKEQSPGPRTRNSQNDRVKSELQTATCITLHMDNCKNITSTRLMWSNTNEEVS